ncbi:MAG TPA: hypothetical protein P5064_05895 [Clostridia bacterium]|jgi:hypothetical protein|nr:hypothetical protein [Clostridiaceae bacterium]HOF26114.1 hypothetical protein [Clostridia bacterium]HQE65367.1 hypothetical protein [Bacillota bacterium]HOM33907.1 hypothetical protein [Clostridia bacterium]HOR89515.1 hypothetical protein [Clostridia bacterium]
MDSKKALRIIIVLLLAVNIFMAAFIINLVYSEPDTKDEHKYITEILAYRDITLDCEIPQYAAPSAVIVKSDSDNSALLSYLEAQGGTISDSQEDVIIYTPAVKQRYEDLTLETAAKIADDFIKKLPVDSQSYMPDSILTAGVGVYKVNYIYLDGSYCIYDKKIEMTISKNGIDRVYIGCPEYTVAETEYNRPMVSVGNILVSGFTRQGRSFITIKKIDAGYIYDKNTSSFVNVWRVMYNNGQERYFSSVDGTVIVAD